jgi:probable HAF family extracellular repeat protein
MRLLKLSFGKETEMHSPNSSLRLLAASACAITVIAAGVNGQVPPVYRVTDLGVPQGWVSSAAFGMNDDGAVVGTANVNALESRAFLWLPLPMYSQPQGMMILAPLLEIPDVTAAAAHDVNNSGQVVGWSTAAPVNAGFLWLPTPAYSLPAGTNALPRRVSGTDREAKAWAITNRTDPVMIAGEIKTGSCATSNLTATVWEADSGTPPAFTLLSPPSPPSGPSWGVTAALAVNPMNGTTPPILLAGTAAPCPDPTIVCGTIGAQGAATWTDAAYTPGRLDLPSPFEEHWGRVHDVNDAGEYVGVALDPNQLCRTRAVYWSGTGTLANLHEDTGLPSLDRSEARAIDKLGTSVVGRNDTTDQALLFTRSGSTWSVAVLDTLIGEAYPGWKLEEAHAINEDGWIVGTGVRNNTLIRAFLLTPLTNGDCLADINEDDVVDVLDLLEVLTNWGCGAGTICPADVTLDGIVNVLDLLQVLGDWGPCGTGNGEIPDSVQECIDKIGFEDPIALQICLEAIDGVYGP